MSTVAALRQTSITAFMVDENVLTPEVDHASIVAIRTALIKVCLVTLVDGIGMQERD